VIKGSIMAMKKTGVLFVCTGNICRSPTAEGVLRHYVQQGGLDGAFHIDSAGTHGYHIGDPPDGRSIEAARLRGILLDDLRARHFEPDDFRRFDYILAMDQGHYRILNNMTSAAGSDHVLSLLMDFDADSKGIDVPDPYYGSAEDFEHALDLVEKGVRAFLDHALSVRKQA